MPFRLAFDHEETEHVHPHLLDELVRRDEVARRVDCFTVFPPLEEVTNWCITSSTRSGSKPSSPSAARTNGTWSTWSAPITSTMRSKPRRNFSR